MASLTFKNATWCLKLSRTSRTFAVSFSTGSPRSHRHRRLSSPAPQPLSTSFTSALPHHSRPSRTPRHAEQRRNFVNTRIWQAQQAAEQSQAAEVIRPDANDLSKGLNEKTLDSQLEDASTDWTRSFQGLSTEAFSSEAAKVLLAPIDTEDIEVKPDGIIYLPEIKYRRILNAAFGPGGWGLAPRGETIVTAKAVTREYALVALGRLVSIARGEQDYFTPDGIPTAVEGCKSTALRRCCKDLGVASELWDPRFIRKFLSENTKEIFVEHQLSKKKKKMTVRNGEKVAYPWKESRYGS